MAIMDQLAAFHAQQTNAYDKLGQARAHFAAMGQALGRLVKLGSNVTRDDITDSLMDLVEEGRLSAKEVAVAIGQMPLQGPALAEWLQNHVQRIMQLDAQATQIQEHARQNMTHSGAHMLAAVLAQGQGQGQAPAPNGLAQAAPAPSPAGGNPLA